MHLHGEHLHPNLLQKEKEEQHKTKKNPKNPNAVERIAKIIKKRYNQLTSRKGTKQCPYRAFSETH
jgi:hypothetical protein